MLQQPNVRHDLTLAEIQALHELPLFELIDRARAVHRESQPPNAVQLCSLLSIKTGGCPEDCGYCSQSSRFRTPVAADRLADLERVLAAARAARDGGASRFCMGAAWRDARDDGAFERVLDMIRAVKALGMETCCSLGMLTDGAAARLKEAGLDAYNHNLDTSRRHYPSIVSSHTFDDRMRTLRVVQRAGIRVCTGGILGLGESVEDRCSMLQELARLDPHPDSVPINVLVPIPGTPLARLPPVDPLEVVRVTAVARILMPSAKVRLSAGRAVLGREAQLLCMYAGANSIFYGDKLLTAPNAGPAEDDALLRAAGLRPMRPVVRAEADSANHPGRRGL
jgi:biotin synthase